MRGRQLSVGCRGPTPQLDSQFLAEHLSAIGTALSVVKRRYMQTCIRIIGVEVSLCGEITSVDIERSKTGRASFTARRMSEIVIAYTAERCRAASSSNVDLYISSRCKAQSADEMLIDSHLSARIEVLGQCATHWPQPISQWIGPVARAIAAI
jgi:hypothetical protein